MGMTVVPAWDGRFLGLLPPAARAAILALGDEHQAEPGTVILWQDQPVDCLALLVSGWTKSAAISPSGRLEIQHLHHPGDLIVQPAGAPRAATVTAGSPTTLRLIAHDDLAAVLATYPQAAAAFRHAACARRQAALRGRRTDSAVPVAIRTARLLVDLHAAFGTGQDPAAPVEIPLGHREIAAMLAASLSTVQPLLSDLRTSGHLTVLVRGRMAVTDLAALRSLAGPPVPAEPCAGTNPSCLACGEGR
ncbi:Crp/Fnr family transcriptional regulator [Frankia sp. ACN10a]|uniref:Crp/Fnr family transcriptional regulator n=1 Tax=Frankia sp. ACN10a TaxID=2926031 RepID=UPI0021197722|nr:Crp/Fnr family transcriptional regulator [Frankia sp. ACN10a]